ncbi:MAG: polysulfide reductase NrfD [Gemmatimonadaceae bacterium]
MSSVATIFAQWTVNPGSGLATPPRWGWYVILYFFIGGLAAGSFVIATLLEIAGDRRDRDAAHLGYRIAFPLIIVCGILLILDLGKPFRFWHMLVQSHRFPMPLYKGYSAISIGSWILTVFGLFSFLAWLNVEAEDDRLRDSWRRRLAPLVPVAAHFRVSSSGFGLLWGLLGTLAGFALGGYTGVLVTDTSVAAWHNSQAMGALFLISGLSTSYALLIRLLLRRGRVPSDSTIAKLASADSWAIGLEIVVLTLLLLSLGALRSSFTRGGFGLVFWLGVVLIGLVAPLAFHFMSQRGTDTAHRTQLAATCVLVGGFLLRVVVVMGPQWPATGLFTL